MKIKVFVASAALVGASALGLAAPAFADDGPPPPPAPPCQDYPGAAADCANAAANIVGQVFGGIGTVVGSLNPFGGGWGGGGGFHHHHH